MSDFPSALSGIIPGYLAGQAHAQQIAQQLIDQHTAQQAQDAQDAARDAQAAQLKQQNDQFMQDLLLRQKSQAATDDQRKTDNARQDAQDLATVHGKLADAFIKLYAEHQVGGLPPDQAARAAVFALRQSPYANLLPPAPEIPGGAIPPIEFNENRELTPGAPLPTTPGPSPQPVSNTGLRMSVPMAPTDQQMQQAAQSAQLQRQSTLSPALSNLLGIPTTAASDPSGTDFLTRSLPMTAAKQNQINARTDQAQANTKLANARTLLQPILARHYANSDALAQAAADFRADSQQWLQSFKEKQQATDQIYKNGLLSIQRENAHLRARGLDQQSRDLNLRDQARQSTATISALNVMHGAILDTVQEQRNAETQLHQDFEDREKVVKILALPERPIDPALGAAYDALHKQESNGKSVGENIIDHYDALNKTIQDKYNELTGKINIMRQNRDKFTENNPGKIDDLMHPNTGASITAPPATGTKTDLSKLSNAELFQKLAAIAARKAQEAGKKPMPGTPEYNAAKARLDAQLGGKK